MILTVCANPSVDSFWSVDKLKKRTTNRSQQETYYPGGKGIHTALALKEFGQAVTTLGIWGGDKPANGSRKNVNKKVLKP